MQGESCMICYEPAVCEKVGPCGHTVHATCIKEWLTRNHKTCPMCTREVQSLISDGKETLVNFLEVSHREELFQSMENVPSLRLLNLHTYYCFLIAIIWYAIVILLHFDYPFQGRTKLQFNLRCASYFACSCLIEVVSKNINLRNSSSEIGFTPTHKIYFDVLAFSLIGFTIFLEFATGSFFSVPYLLIFFNVWCSARSQI